MGNFSRKTFNPDNGYTSVRLQQGVPLVDADINELQDVLKHAMEGALRDFVGNGVPYGDNGFGITPVRRANDFAIAPGRCLVAGGEAINTAADLTYRGQDLFGDDELAADWEVAPLPELEPNVSRDPRTDVVYLDVWEREIGHDEDPNIVNDLIGIETSVRDKREWVVRVAQGAEPGAPPRGHAFYPLATLTRRRGETFILNIADRRRTGLRMPSYHDLQQVVADAFGGAYAFDPSLTPNTGEPRLKVSLREAINALLRGRLPMTAEHLVAGPGRYARPQELLRLSSGEIWLLYTMLDTTSTPQEFSLHYDRLDPDTDSWIGGGQIAALSEIFFSKFYGLASMAQDASGRLWVVWWEPDGDNVVINYWRYDPANDTSVGPLAITSDSMDFVPRLATSTSGEVLAFWQRRATDANRHQILTSRYEASTDTWGEPDPVTTLGSNEHSVETLSHSNGDVWAFWTSDRDSGGIDDSGTNFNIYCDRFSPTTGFRGNEQVTTDSAQDHGVKAVEDANGDIWIFWLSNRNDDEYQVFSRRYSMARESWDDERFQLSTSHRGVYEVFPLAARNGDIWIFWQEGNLFSTVEEIFLFYKRRSADGGWGPPVQLSADTTWIVAEEGADSDILVAYSRLVVGDQVNTIVTSRQIIPRI